MNRKELAQSLAKELASIIREYREAESRVPQIAPSPGNSLSDDLEQAFLEASNRGAIFSEHKVTISATTYWEDILRAKIKVVGIVGGISLMRDVATVLEESDEQGSGYKYLALFSYCADGLYGWIA